MDSGKVTNLMNYLFEWAIVSELETKQNKKPVTLLM